MDTNTPVTNEETSAIIPAETAPAPAPRPRKPRTPKPKPRDMEVLHEATIKSMTDEEKAICIEEYRKSCNFLVQQNELLSENCKEAYEKFKAADAECKRIESEANAKLAFCKQSIEVCYKTIKMLENKS